MLEKAETRENTQQALVVCSMFDSKVFKNRNRVGDVWWICISESMVLEVWGLCHQSDAKGFFMLSARQKIHFLNNGCDTCLKKIQSMPMRTGEQDTGGRSCSGSSFNVGNNQRQ